MKIDGELLRKIRTGERDIKILNEQPRALINVILGNWPLLERDPSLFYVIVRDGWFTPIIDIEAEHNGEYIRGYYEGEDFLYLLRDNGE